jgi:Uma2 family endonuclease
MLETAHQVVRWGSIQMVQTPTKPLTLEAFLAMPETQPASEFIDGQIIQKPMPQGEHSTLQGELIIVLNGALRPASRAYPELRCTFGGRSTVPDVAVFRSERIPRKANGAIENVFPIAPDWTIEILSPDQDYKKVAKNILHCLDHGCQMGWLIDPEEKTVVVSPQDSRSRTFEASDAALPVPDWASGLALTVGDLFGWLVG